jgi:catechol 2,3-dioxygenase-like lactoylglutathione lyase family enzyme
MITREELPDSYEVVDGIGQRVAGNTIAYVLGPDDIKVELIENTALNHAVQMHHIHFSTTQGEAMRDWYVEHLGAEFGSRIGQPAGQLPNVNLTFAPVSIEPKPTQGHRARSHRFRGGQPRSFLRRTRSERREI